MPKYIALAVFLTFPMILYMILIYEEENKIKKLKQKYKEQDEKEKK